ncbi:MAG: MarR family transcriptional regulator [Solirubrobacteraceae bacterium]|jgi:DNA-binding MarR family transcriptional regulator
MARVKSSSASLALPLTTADASASRVGYLLYRVERRLRRRLDAMLRAHGITTTEYVALSVLRAHEGMSSADLARWTFVTPQAMSLVIGTLERRGLISRSPDERHRRVLKSAVTARGARLLERCDEAMDTIEGDMLDELDAGAREELRHALLSCARSLEVTHPLPAARRAPQPV